MGSTVKDVMTTQVVTVGTAASFKEMVVKMRESGVSALPVVDGEGRVIGVVSEADMLNKEAGLDTEPGELSSLLRFTEREKAAGVTAAELVTLTGRTDTGQLARGLVAVIRQIDGVVAVRDQLGYPGEAQ